MAKKKSVSPFEKEVIGRTRMSRSGAGFTQETIAEKLGIERTTYAKYELDRIMDLQLVGHFCKLTEVSLNFLLTGKEDRITKDYYSLPKEKKGLVDDIFFANRIRIKEARKPIEDEKRA